MAIVIDKYDIVWYGAFVLEGDLQKVPSSLSLRVLLISFAQSSSGLLTSRKVSKTKDWTVIACLTQQGVLPIYRRENGGKHGRIDA